MVYLRIQGNCGNQFFQYAFARVLQEKYGGDLVIDYSLVQSDKTAWDGSNNLLSCFNTVPYEYVIEGHKNPHKYLAKLTNKLGDWLNLKPYTKRNYKYYVFWAKYFERFGIYYFSSSFFKYKFNAHSDVYVNGYFESPRYFENIDKKICKELSPKYEVLDCNKDMHIKILNSESICISVNRRNIDNKNTREIYGHDIGYFYYAIEYIKKRIYKPVWFVFSDNIEWCKKNILIDGEVYYENSNNPIWEKVRLMSSCKHFIICNSTFSWWAQHLSDNKNKIVISPARWLQREDQPIDIYEDYFTYITDDGIILENHL